MSENIEIAKIINKHIDKSKFKDSLLISSDDINFDTSNEVIDWNIGVKGNHFKYSVYSKDKIAFLLTKLLATERKSDFGTFFHFIKLKHALAILENNEIQLSSLSSLTENDSAEYSEFLSRYNYNPAFNDVHISNAKDSIYVFCLTKEFRNQKFWNEYLKDTPGVCIGFRFEKYNIDLFDFFEFIDVIYDDGYSFDFLNDIQREIKNKFNKRLYIGGMNRIARHYKRNKYSWESETRLIFDFFENKMLHQSPYFKGITGKDLNQYLKPEFDEVDKRFFLRINLDNPFFKINISEIICGKEINDDQIITIKSMLSKNVKVWRVN